MEDRITSKEIEIMIQEEIAKAIANDDPELAEALGLAIEDLLKERELTEPEEEEKERLVKGMKKGKEDFEKRYGDDAESVMYATATKKAKEKA
tara:strand:+ start:454 stop:732 length:279 start_codon:yes stop_codon:yes gene_type:complete